MENYQPQSTANETFVRLGQTRDRGCLLVFNAQESIHLFVANGFVISATSARKAGEAALDLALHLEGSSYGWIPGAEPAGKDMNVDIQDYVVKHSIVKDPRVGKTIRISVPVDRKEKKLDFHYYFIPEESPTFKLKVRKTTNVVGREGSCDICIESFQVSRRHCLLQITERGLLVKDLESTNGTFANGIPMTDGYINDGDRLSLGTYVLTLHREKL